ncbi:hypothetical protein CEXT_596891 [Caerostris extrusa]|uniref:Uncharacterized protein n=1 Tax=Caerostris extrusa TaxID=172846 RepID=A0AAV4T8E7_CAEEX|nr:hypothetical protein CEXT_596891 [Caerostris extrusa]
MSSELENMFGLFIVKRAASKKKNKKRSKGGTQLQLFHFDGAQENTLVFQGFESIRQITQFGLTLSLRSTQEDGEIWKTCLDCSSLGPCFLSSGSHSKISASKKKKNKRSKVETQLEIFHFDGALEKTLVFQGLESIGQITQFGLTLSPRCTQEDSEIWKTCLDCSSRGLCFRSSGSPFKDL